MSSYLSFIGKSFRSLGLTQQSQVRRLVATGVLRLDAGRVVFV